MLLFKNFILVHCTFAIKISLSTVVLCIGTKPRNSSKLSKFLKPSVIKILKVAISFVSVLAS